MLRLFDSGDKSSYRSTARGSCPTGRLRFGSAPQLFISTINKMYKFYLHFFWVADALQTKHAKQLSGVLIERTNLTYHYVCPILCITIPLASISSRHSLAN